jgi:hypothetical protein
MIELVMVAIILGLMRASYCWGRNDALRGNRRTQYWQGAVQRRRA